MGLASRIGFSAPRVRRAALILSLPSLSVGGCGFLAAVGVDTVSVVLGYEARKGGGALYRRWIPGVDLRMGGVWSGLNLGFSDITVMQVVADNESETRRDREFLPPLGWLWRGEDGVERSIGFFVRRDSAPHGLATFVYQGYAGLGVNTSEMGRGIKLGLGRTTLLWSEENQSAVFALRFSSKQPESGNFSLVSSINE